MTDTDRRLVDLVDDRVADSLQAMALPPASSLQVGYLLRNCRLRSVAAITAIPARSVSEFTEWFRKNERFRLFPEPKPDVFSMVMRTITILACRLRLNSGVPSALESTGHRVLPALPVTVRAKRELRPKQDRCRPVSRSATLTRSRVYAKRIAAARVAPLRDVKAFSTVCTTHRPSLFPRKRVPRRVPLEPRGSAVVMAAAPTVPHKKPSYIPRKLFLANRGESMQAQPSERDPRDCLTLRTIFSPPLKKLTCVWQTAKLFRGAPGFFRYAEWCRVGTELLEACFRLAIGKRCVTNKTQLKAAGFVSAFVLFAVDKQHHFYGFEALFALILYFSGLKNRGVSVPGAARWALKVYDEILSLNLPLQHPAIVAVTSRDRSGVPKVVKQAPMLDFQLIIDLERVALDGGCPMGMRFYASAYLLMVFASLRFSDCRAVYEIWESETAICGRSIDLKLKRMPIITWATPKRGIHSEGKWAAPLFRVWKQCPPLKGGHHALSRHSTDSWEVDISRKPNYYVVQKLFKKLCEHLGYEDPKWTLHSARAWFPTCANQLGWSEEERRRLGHWAPGSQMMDTYDRALRTTELRLRSSIFEKITIADWVPTHSFEVPNKAITDDTIGHGDQTKQRPL